MAQLHFTLDSDFFVGLFLETKDEAFANLWKLYLIRFFKLNLPNNLVLITMNVRRNVLITETEPGQGH